MEFLESLPRRIQLSRAKGWRIPPNTVKVDRSTAWGNPYRDDDPVLPWGASSAAEAFTNWLRVTAEGQALRNRAARELRGKQLACWCSLQARCHADVLIRVANER